MKRRLLAGLFATLLFVGLFFTMVTAENLKYGAAGKEVTQAQKRLEYLGYYTDKIDGKFGYSTYLAVRGFQGKNKLKVDGVIGINTSRVLYSATAIARSGKAGGATSSLRISYGSEGPSVSTVQTRLRTLKFYSGSVDGKYGYSTYMAVRAFQRSKSLQVDGIVGPKTWAALIQPLVAPKPTPKPAPKPENTTIPKNPRVQYGSSGYLVRLVQQELTALKYKPGKIDGKFGYTTYLAVRSFQSKNNLQVDGIVGGKTWNKLFGGFAKPAVAPKAPTTYVFRLSYGASGSTVVKLQDALNALGYLGNGQNDGIFGYRTYLAVRSFQSVNKLKVDGVVGPKTWSLINSPDAKPKPKTTATK